MSNQTHFVQTFQLSQIKKVVDVASSHFTSRVRKSFEDDGFTEIGSVAPSLPTYDQLVYKFQNNELEVVEGRSYSCVIRPDQVYTSLDYNRGEEISGKKIKENLTKYKGYNHALAGSIQLIVRPDGEGSYIWNIPITTKGNHRTAGADALDVPLIKADVFFHNKDLSEKDCITLEAIQHHGDCVDRSNQIPHQKFVSAVFAGQADFFADDSPEKKAVDLNNFLNERGYFVSTKIYGLNVETPFEYNPLADFSKGERAAKHLTSHDSITTARTKYGDRVVGEILESLHEKSRRSEVPSNFVRACSLFFYLLEEYDAVKGFVDDTKYVNKNITPMDFLIKKTGKTARWIKNDFFNYTLNECKPRITFEKITADSGKYKGPELYAARLVYLFNNYVQDRLEEGIFPQTCLSNRRVRFLCSNDPQWQRIRQLGGSGWCGSLLDAVMTNGGGAT